MTGPQSSSVRDRSGVTTILWDLDGTLVGIRRRPFVVLMSWVSAVVLADLIPPWKLLPALKHLLPRLRNNASNETNHALLVALLAEEAGVPTERVEVRLRRLVRSGFPLLRRCFYRHPEAISIVGELASRGMDQVIATNPLWPLDTVLARLRWGGLHSDRFTFLASGETMRRAKPQVAYYSELLEHVGARPQHCLMIGNDMGNDAPVAQLGVPVYVLGGVPSANPLIDTGDWAALRAWLGLRATP